MTGLPPEKADSRQMREMFETIAPRYDFITRAFSFGMDREWKRQALEGCGLPPGARVLDLACGTGDFSKLAVEAGLRPVGADLTFGMLRESDGLRHAVCGDAMRLPFADSSFDAVCVGYGVRNFPDLGKALGEVRRVLRPGGVLASLDFFLPENRVWRELFLGYMHAQGAFWGLALHGQARIYTYIPRSLRSFLTSQGYSDLLGRSGFQGAGNRRYLLGAIQVHWARAK